MSLTVDFGITKLQLAKLASEPLRPWMAAVANMEKAKIVERITTTKEDAEGQAWEQWRPLTEHLRTLKGNAGLGLLHDEGRLLAGIISDVSEGTIQIGVISDVFYAKALQEGEHMVARPFMGWSGAELAEYELDAIAFLELLMR
jgi:hypothetical protein